MPFKTLLARTTAVLAALAAAAASVIALEPGSATAGSVAPLATTVTTPGAAGAVSGQVLGNSTGGTENAGSPVAGDTVTLINTADGGAVATATTDPSGDYSFSAVAAGTYYVEFGAVNAGSTNYQTQYLGGSQVAASSQTITLTSTTSITGADATLVPWNTPQPTVTSPPVTITSTVTTGGSGITINQQPPTTTVTKTVTTPAKTTTVTKTVTTTKTTPAKTTTTKASGTPTAPSVASGSLGGIGARNVALKFKVVAGSTELRSFQVKLPKGFSFASKKLKAGLKLGKLNFTSTLSGGVLNVTLKSAQKSFTATFGGGAITTTTAIVREALIHKLASAKVTLAVTDAKNVKTALPFVIAKPS